MKQSSPQDNKQTHHSESFLVPFFFLTFPAPYCSPAAFCIAFWQLDSFVCSGVSHEWNDVACGLLYLAPFTLCNCFGSHPLVLPYVSTSFLLTAEQCPIVKTCLILVVPSPTDGHLGGFSDWGLVRIQLPWALCVRLCVNVTLFSLSEYVAVGDLGPLVGVFSLFTRLFSKVVGQLNLPLRSVCGFRLLHILAASQYDQSL